MSKSKNTSKQDRKTPGANQKFNSKKKTFPKEEKTSSGSSSHGGTIVRTNGISDELYKSAASITWPAAMGTVLDLNENPMNIVTSAMTQNFDTPGVVAIGYVPTPGYSEDWTSPISVTLRSWFTDIRKGNTTTAPYNAAETCNFLLQYGSCRSFGLWVARLYGLLKMYTGKNKYTPVSLMTACGGVFKDINRNSEALRGWLNNYIQQLSHYHVPNLPFFSEQDYLLNNVFRDCNSLKSSFYVFNPEGFWFYDLEETPEDSGMRLLKRPEGTVEAIMDFGDRMLNALMNNNIYNDMNADFERICSDWLPLTLFSEAHVIEPVFDEALLLQIHNATVILGDNDFFENQLSNWVIWEDISESENVGAVHFQPHIWLKYTGNTAMAADKMLEDSLIYASNSKIMDVPIPDPSYQTAVVASRWMVAAEPSLSPSGGNLVFNLTGFGSEILTSLKIMNHPGDTLHTVVAVGNSDDLVQLRKVDYSPIIAEYGRADTNGENGTLHIMRGAFHTGLLDNFTKVTRDNVKSIHHVRLLTSFGIAK